MSETERASAGSLGETPTLNVTDGTLLGDGLPAVAFVTLSARECLIEERAATWQTDVPNLDLEIFSGGIVFRKQAWYETQILWRDGDALALVYLSSGNVTVRASARTVGESDQTIAVLRDAIPEAMAGDGRVPMTFYAQTANGPRNWTRRIVVPPWLSITGNYAATTRRELEGMMRGRVDGSAG